MFTVVFVVARNTKISCLHLSPQKASISFSLLFLFSLLSRFCHDASKDILLKTLFVCYRLELMYQTS